MEYNKKETRDHPAQISSQVALSYAKKAVGTDPRFFPNYNTMVVMWHVVAEVVLEAMEEAWEAGYLQRGKEYAESVVRAMGDEDEEFETFGTCLACGGRTVEISPGKFQCEGCGR